MVLYPGAAYRPLAGNPEIEGALTDYDILCFHTMVGSLWGTDAYFRREGYSGTESHFGVGFDGECLQWQDTRWRADANLDGVDRVISVETADYGPGFPAWSGSNVPAWTAAQVERNAQIAAWAHRTHGIPLVLIPNTAQSSRGIGYHRQGIDPWRCAVCERWSASSGKVCPGDRRVAQMPQIITRAQQIVSGEDWLDMATKEDVKDAVREVLAEQAITLDWDGGPPNARKWSVFEALGKLIHFNAADGSFEGDVPATSLRTDQAGKPSAYKRLVGKLDEILSKLPPGEGDPVEPPSPTTPIP